MDHRDAVGGLWDELGTLQFNFLLSQGLEPRSCVLDVGCGSLRAGVHLARYLEPGRYFGCDSQQWLLDAGRCELEANGIVDRVPAANLRCTSDFDVTGWGGFDFTIAQSVFTHLPLPRLAQCLRAIAPALQDKPFFATFFVGPAYGDVIQRPGGILTKPNADPFHFTQSAIQKAANGAGWRMDWIGAWGHPRNQQMARFWRA